MLANTLDRPLKPQEIDYISKRVNNNNEKKRIAFCLTKKGLVKDLPAECKKVRKDFREYSKTLPKVNKPKPPCKPGKVREDRKCKTPKVNKPKPPCKPGKVREDGGRCKTPKVNKPKAKRKSAELFVLTTNKTLNPMINSNVRLNENMTSNATNISGLFNPISENQKVVQYVERKVKAGDMIPGDVVYIGTDYTSRPEYGFGIITGMSTIDTTFGPNDIRTILYADNNDKNDVMKQLKVDFNISYDKVLKKIFKFVDFLNSY